jgi:hypothetical protein
MVARILWVSHRKAEAGNGVPANFWTLKVELAEGHPSLSTELELIQFC